MLPCPWLYLTSVCSLWMFYQSDFCHRAWIWRSWLSQAWNLGDVAVFEKPGAFCCLMTRGTWVGTRIWKRDMALYEKSLVLVCCRRTSFIPFPLPLPPQQCIGTSGRKRLLRARDMLIATLGSSCDEDIMNLSHTAKHYLSEAPRSASTTVILPSPFLFFYVRFYNWLASILPWWFIPCRTMMFFLLWCDSYSEWAFGQLLL